MVETSPPPLRRTEGFTLIEVLVAMVLLAVGLLGLEALAIGASRSIALAEKQSEYANVASRYLEVALDSIRTAPTQVTTAVLTGTDLPEGDTIRRTVTPSGTGLYTVRLEILPARSGALRPDTFTLEASAYVPTP